MDIRKLENAFFNIKVVCQFTQKSKPTIYVWVRKGIFPPPVQLGPNSVAWRESELQAWAADPKAWGAAQ